MITTIQIEKNLKKKLDKLKIHPRETYNDILIRLLEGTSLKKIDKESLIETVEILSDPKTMRDIAEALEEFSQANFVELK